MEKFLLLIKILLVITPKADQTFIYCLKSL